MNNKSFVIGVDLGGTNLRAAGVDDSGKILVSRSAPVGDKSSSAVVAAIAGSVSEIANDIGSKPVAVGCGVPGIVDAENGVVHASPNFPAWSEEKLRDAVCSKVGVPVAMENDANCFALAEAMLGAGRGHRNVVMLTLGTGIGGGLVFDGKVFHGDSGFAGEVGHIVVEPDGEPCGCGGRGCLERYAASHAFAVHARRLPNAENASLLAAAGVDASAITPELAARLADEGNESAAVLWNEFGRYLGIGIATLVNILGVFTFVIGGGITKSWDRFISAAKAAALSHTYARHAAYLKLLRAGLGDNAGVIGAAIEARRLI